MSTEPEHVLADVWRREFAQTVTNDLVERVVARAIDALAAEGWSVVQLAPADADDAAYRVVAGAPAPRIPDE
jgi:hypothetical protein